MWAQLESELAALLRHYLTGQFRHSKTLKGLILACAIFGSMRLKSSRDTMKRIATELNFSSNALNFHEAFFTHIAHIEDLRDKLAHHLVRPANETYDGKWIVTDITTTRAVKSFKVYEFETDAVAAAAHDLYDAGQTIGGFFKKGVRRSAPPLPSWRYKPSMLKLRRDKKPLSPQAPPRPFDA